MHKAYKRVLCAVNCRSSVLHEHSVPISRSFARWLSLPFCYVLRAFSLSPSRSIFVFACVCNEYALCLLLQHKCYVTCTSLKKSSEENINSHLQCCAFFIHCGYFPFHTNWMREDNGDVGQFDEKKKNAHETISVLFTKTRIWYKCAVAIEIKRI